MAVIIEPLISGQQEEAVRLLAHAFVTSPLHIAVFGVNQLPRNEAFFHMVLGAMKGEILAATDDARILGIIHWVDSARCQVPLRGKLRMIPSIFRDIGLRSAVRMNRWISIWSRHDPKEHHLHLGPIGVLPEVQGCGIGRQLMERYCSMLDEKNITGYLETDRLTNVDFYTKFGFDVGETVSIYGVTNYFMYRRTSKL